MTRTQYRIEWIRSNGKKHYTYANTEEMARHKANKIAEDPKVAIVNIFIQVDFEHVKCDLDILESDEQIIEVSE